MQTRRDFLGRVAMWASMAASYGTAVALAARYLYPRKREAAKRSVYLARLEELADGGSRRASDLRGRPLVVVRQGQTVRALSMVCPHLGCSVRWEGDKSRFFCPCHDGVFDAEGRVVSGPPPRPLERYDVEVLGGNVYLAMKEESE